MAQSSLKQLSKRDFDAQNYVHEISSGGDGHKDLLEHRQRVQNLNDETAVAMKKNVYKNYTQFIETAKEISLLESEMYQLSHILTEQKGLLGQILDMSITAASEDRQTDEAGKKEKDEKKKTLTSLLEKVEGLTNVTEVPGRFLVHEGDLLELNVDNFEEIRKVHAFLLNDSVMITTYLPTRRGPLRYKFLSLFELDNLAVVNARDVGLVKNAFKILMFPDQHMYQCDGPKTKREWLVALEKTKKNKSGSSGGQRKDVSADTTVSEILDRSNPFFDAGPSHDVSMEINPLHPDWLVELPEDLDVCIAQRDFEGAVDLIDRTNEHVRDLPLSSTLKEIRARVDHRVKQLTDVLVQEMEVSADRSLRGGPGVTRRAVIQLVRLGKHTTACNLFLKHRSAAIKLAIRRLKIEGITTVYINKLCSIFFTHLIETGKEFQKAFAENTGCFSAFVVWARVELQTFVGHFSNQAFATKSNLDMVAECIIIARRHCQKMCNIGLDLSFALDGFLLKGIRDTIRYNKDQLMEATKHRSGVDEKWRPVNMQTPEAATQLAKEMVQYGIHNFNSQLYNKCWVNLSNSTIMFSKGYMNFINNLMTVYIPELYFDIVDSLREVLEFYIGILESCATNEAFMQEREFILKNVDFMFQTIIPLTENKGKEAIGHQVRPFKDLYKEQRKINSKVESLGVLI
ncbi:exocyst complex component 8-like [Glandiceps talaboti]